MIAVALIGCASDPALEAWHGSVAVDSVARIDGACDEALVEVEPELPYLFVAVDRGVPDVASLYWCEDPESCGVPFSSVWLTRLDEEEMTGELGTASVDDDLCLVRWDDLAATRDGDQVEIVVRTGQSTVLGVDATECADLVKAYLGDACNGVMEIRGTRVD